MKRTLFTVMIALAVLTGAYSIAGAADGPHQDYRLGDTSAGTAYDGGSCTKGAACHNLTKVTFLPDNINASAPLKDFTNFCLACHNAAGEAHNKSAGSPSNNVYHGSTTIPGNRGDSHSWNGKNHNAGTRTPTSAGFSGTSYMPGADNRVTCQTCHDGMDKTYAEDIENWVSTTSSDGINYTMLGYAGTKQYLAQYVKVYRSTTPVGIPATTRAKNSYLVSPSEYTYNNTNATVTFKTSQTGNSIYVEIPQPYLRVDNSANAICLDCHNDRISSGVTHAPGTGATNGHPVKVNYGHSSGLNDTLKPAGTGNVYFENISGNQKVLCTTCHDPHNSTSKNGQIMREADGYTLCADCHKTILGGYSSASQGVIVNIHNGSKHSSPTYCLDCHTTHNSNNVLMIKNTINGKNVNFQSFTGARSFGPDTGFGICEVCHSATNHHRALNNSTTLGHHTGEDCTQCHSHSNGFQPIGGCTDCHGFPPSPTKAGPSGWADTVGGKHVVHMTYIRNKFGAGLSDEAVCKYCHGPAIPTAVHQSPTQTTAYIDLGLGGGGTFSNGGTIGKVNTADDSCTSVACHSTTNIRYWSDTAAACDSCHEYPGSATNDWPAYNGHSMRADSDQSVSGAGTKNYLKHLNVATAYNAATDTYVSVTSDVNKCGKCHPNTSTNHMDGFIELAPNGYGAGGGNFNITLGKVTGNTVQCSNVACHFSRQTPNWY